MLKLSIVLGIALYLLPIEAKSEVIAGPESGMVQGRVSFERRNTIVPMMVCEENLPCAQPEPYWSFVVQGKEMKYELDQTFYLGRENAPEMIEISGLQIRSGAEVQIEGRVQKITDQYSIVSEVRKIEYVNRRPGTSEVTAAMRSVSIEAGWDCQSDLRIGTEIGAEVLYTISNTDRVKFESFQLRLMSQGMDGTREIARIQNLGIDSDTNKIVYKGTDHGLAVELAIRKSAESFFDLPGALKLWRAEHSNAEAPADALISLKCNRRF